MFDISITHVEHKLSMIGCVQWNKYHLCFEEVWYALDSDVIVCRFVVVVLSRIRSNAHGYNTRVNSGTRGIGLLTQELEVEIDGA